MTTVLKPLGYSSINVVFGGDEEKVDILESVLQETERRGKAAPKTPAVPRYDWEGPRYEGFFKGARYYYERYLDGDKSHLRRLPNCLFECLLCHRTDCTLAGPLNREQGLL